MWKVLRAGALQKSPILGQLQCSNCSRSINGNFKSFYLSSRTFTIRNGKCFAPASSTREIQDAYKASSSSDDKKDGMPAGGLFLLVIPVTTFCLGVWQVLRWRWKLGLIEEMRLKSTTDPVPLPEDELYLEELEYRKVKLRGSFDYSKEVLMGPRSLVIPEDRSSERGRGVFSSGSGNNGFLVITPFQLEGSSERILVNRGWINARSPEKFRHIEGPVEIIGVVRKTENRAPFMSKNKPGQNLLHYRDVPTMSEMLDTKQVFLDLFAIDGVDFSKARQDSIPVPRQTRVTLRNEHVSYFVTWFSLSAITSFMWHRRFIRRLNLL